MTTNRWVRLINRLAGASSLLGAGIAALALWSWAGGVADLFAIGSQRVPMALSVALLLVLAGCAIFLWTCWPDRLGVRRFCFVVVAGMGIAGLLAGLRTWFGWGSPLETWMAEAASALGNRQAGQMSPLTGMAFFAVGTAFLLSLRLQRRRPSRWLAFALLFGVAILGAGAVGSYALGKPWLYGSGLIPMAFLTALSLGLMGLALLCDWFLAGAAGATGEPGVKDKAPMPAVRGQALVPMAVFAALAAVIGTVSALYVRHMQSQSRADARAVLEAVGELKAAEVVNWREERLHDAQFVAQSAFVGHDVQAFLSDPVSDRARSRVLRWLELLMAGDRYQAAAFFDTNSVLRLAVPGGIKEPPSALRELSAVALQTNRAFISEFHRGAGKDEIHLDILFPVFAPPSAAEPTPAEAMPRSAATRQLSVAKAPVALGAVLLRLDPHRFLYPLLRKWPTPARTAETVLVRRDGDRVVYLNDLRRATNAPLTLRLPLDSRGSLTSSKALLGQAGAMEGTDYSGASVLASAHRVPGSSWFLIVKVDHDEIYAPLRRQAALALNLTVVLAAAAGLVAWLIWKYREAGATRRELAAERERLVLAQRLEHVLRQAGDAIILGNGEDRVLEANDRALEMYGYSLAEFQSLGMAGVRAPQVRAGFQQQMEKLNKCGQALYETLHQRKDGSVFPVEVSCSVIEIDGVRYKLGFLRDISNRRARQKEIGRLTRLYATLSALNRSIVRARSRDELFQSACTVTVRHAGFKLAWIGCTDPETQQLKPVAQDGDSLEYLRSIRVYADDRPEGRGPTGQCIRLNQPFVCSDFLSDPCTAPWQEAARRHGIRAVAALPLAVGGRVVGAFTVYADEPGVFQDKELALLEEIAMDISYALRNLEEEKKRCETERALEESERQLRTILRTAKDGFWMLDTQGRFVEVNDAACELCGYSREELLGMSIQELEASESPAEVVARFERIRSRGWDHFETRLRRKDGSVFDAELSVNFLDLGDGYLVAFCRDITGRKHAEATLRERVALQDQLAGITATVPGVIYSFRLRPGGAVSMPYVSGAFAEVYGLRPEEVRDDASLALALIHPEDLGRVNAAISESARTLTPWRAEFRLRRAGFGEGWVEGHSVPHLEPDGSVLWHGFIWDITERREAEAEREATVRLLHLANASNSLRELLSGTTGLLRDLSGCEAVGVRLADGEDFPYFETRGFPSAFVHAESSLCRCDAKGQPLRDSHGNPVLECMCGNVLCGRFDPAKPFFSARGSFWSNCTTELLASTTDADRQARTRNRCKGEGYESVALIPIRTGTTVHGLLQLNDKRKGRFTEHKVRFLEQLADNLANAIAHRQAEEAMRESEERFRQLAESIECVFWMTDARLSKMLYISPAYEPVWGRTRASLYAQPKSFLEAVHTEDRERVSATLVRCHHDAGAEFELEYRIIRPDHSVRWIRDRGFPIRNEAGELVRVVGIADDVSERKQAEAALKLSEQRYRALFDGGNDAIFLCSITPDGQIGNFVDVNELACQRLGYTREELLRKTPFDLDPCVTEEQMRAMVIQLRAGAGVVFQTEKTAKDGRRFPVEVSSRLFEWGGRSLVLSIVRDLSDRKAAEAALRESERRFRDMMENVQLLAVLLDEQNRILFCNEYLLNLSGRKREEVMGRDYLEVFIAAEERERVRQVAASVLGGSPVPHFENEIVTQKGEGRLIAWNNTCLKDANGKIIGIASIGEDITDRKRLETQLRQAQKMEGIGQLAGGVAHDFNNILAATMLNLELLQTDNSLSPATQETLKELMVQAERAAGLTRQLLLFSRRSVMQVRAVDLNDIIENLLKMLRRLIGEHINLEWRSKSELPQVMADAGMLEQVVMNLVVNARDAMPKCGQLTLATAGVELRREQIPTRSGAQPGRFVCLSVTDTGCGMDDTVQKRIFEPFFTTKEPGKGTGLGLATVYGIISQHRGCIVVESQEGKGSTFRVFLPVADKPAKIVLSGPKREPARGGAETILLVEDDAAVRKTTRGILRHWGYNVLEAENGVEALTVWNDHSDRVDMLFTDMVMPAGISGLDLAERLRTAKPELKVLISSGYSAELLHQGAAVLEGIHYTPKPCPPAELAAIIRQCLDKPPAAGRV